MPSEPEATGNAPGDAIETPDVGPTDAEIEAWAQHERQRRESWLRGPTQAQKSDWAARERGRRLAELSGQGSAPRASSGEPRLFLVQRYAREAQLAAEGAFSLMLNLSMREMFDQLIQAGRDWEQEYASRPVRRRIPLGDQAGGVMSDRDSGSESPGTASQTS
ncbi:MAG: hypothetical protein JOZ87_11235 [Chloroflexi bacterium]|nr:hypothetical protein [Chloroflexota bacterium]